MGENGNILNSAEWGLGDTADKAPKKAVELSKDTVDELDEAAKIEEDIKRDFKSGVFGKDQEADLKRWQEMERLYGMGQIPHIPQGDEGDTNLIYRPGTARIIEYKP